MLVAVFTTFASSRKQPLGDVVERVHAAFVATGFGERTIRFSTSDPPDSPEISAITAAMGTKRVSSIGRILKRWPELAPFVRLAGAAGRQLRMMSNLSDGGAVTPIDFVILKEIAQGVPRSFPCHRMTLHFQAAGFSDGLELPATADPRGIAMLARAGVDVFAGHPTSAGISVTDSWWVNGRQRSLAALRLVEADPAAKKASGSAGRCRGRFRGLRQSSQDHASADRGWRRPQQKPRPNVSRRKPRRDRRRAKPFAPCCAPIAKQ